MSKCDLRVELDPGPTSYRPGEEITGTVHASVDANVRCRLVATLAWSTHGQGNRTGRTHASIDLYDGPWAAGDELRYPFSFRLPNGPFTYRGKLLNVDWAVHARADIPWAIDPKAEHDFVLLPGRSQQPIDRGPSFSGIEAAESKIGKGCMILFFGVFFVVGVAVGGVGLADYLGYDTGATGDVWVALIIGPIFTLVGMIPFFVWLHGFLARRKTGKVKATLSRRELRTGDRLEVEVAFEPRADFLIHAITAHLEASEVVTRGSGTNKVTRRHAAVDETIELFPEGMARAFDPISCSAALTIPEDAPLTFRAPDNRLDWSVTLRVDIPGWPDWSEEFPLLVDPAPRERTDGGGLA